MALEYSPEPQGKIEKMVEELKEEVTTHFPDVPIYVSLVSPVIGAHAGPGAIAISLITK